MPILWIADDDAIYEEGFGASVSVFEDWAIIGYLELYSDTKYVSHFYRRESGACKYHQSLKIFVWL